MSMIERREWKEFQASGLLWWINRILHTFGWAIVFEIADDDEGLIVYPARVKFRGFDIDSEVKGFIAIAATLRETAAELDDEVNQ